MKKPSKNKIKRVKVWAVVYDDDSIVAFFTSKLNALDYCRKYQSIIPLTLTYKLP